MNPSEFQRERPEPTEAEIAAVEEIERRLAVATVQKRSPRWNLILFGATLATTTLAGSFDAGVDPFSSPWAFTAGFPFSLTLLAILLSHEFGHYFLARWHGIPTSLPFFIPGPPILIGTFGAFIRMHGMPRSRKALFDVGAAGPWAGMIVAVPAVIIGLALSEVRPVPDVLPLPDEMSVGITFGNSLLFELLSRLTLGVDPDSVTVILHPVALAGWFGLFVTFLNLLPVGQLDGGHVVYALFGKRHRAISRVVLVAVIGLGFYGWDGWLLWAFMLVFILKVDHPDTADAETPLDPFRRRAAWATIAMFVLTFMPVPLDIVTSGDLGSDHPLQERHDPRERSPASSSLQSVGVSIPEPAVVPTST